MTFVHLERVPPTTRLGEPIISVKEITLEGQRCTYDVYYPMSVEKFRLSASVELSKLILQRAYIEPLYDGEDQVGWRASLVMMQEKEKVKLLATIEELEEINKKTKNSFDALREEAKSLKTSTKYLKAEFLNYKKRVKLFMFFSSVVSGILFGLVLRSII